jgi:alpha-ketoglutarate-dependent taurine dioxygenase
MDDVLYQSWRDNKLAQYPQSAEDLCVEIGGLNDVSEAQKAAIIANCAKFNMCIYRCCDAAADRASVRAFAAEFGLLNADLHLCANDDGVSELSVAGGGVRNDYVPYSNRGLSWHTDGYYNPPGRRVRAVVLHCERDAAEGGENALLDPDIAYIRLRDADPGFITAFEHPQCMTIPANENAGGETRPEVTGAVFSYEPGAALHMRFSARRKNIRWRDDALTLAARKFLAQVLADADGPVLHYRLKPGEGLISNNVLHNRTAFSETESRQRLLYRARFFDRVTTG